MNTKQILLLLLASVALPQCKSPEESSTNIPLESVDSGYLNVKKSCTVSPEEFNSWFADDKATANGVVKPANSLQNLLEIGDFYKWSWQMFLWQTSPKNNGLVFNQPPFYDVDASGNLISNGGDSASLTRLRGIKSEDVDSTGQAGILSGVLMTQNTGITPEGSLVYYAIHVNQAYAYMASGKNAKPAKLDSITQFPTTKNEIDSIVSYAKRIYNVDISDSEALTMELKSSWVKADKVKDLSKYLTIKADIPRYNKTDDKHWSWDGSSMEKDVTLACIGYHIVGSSANHPEMIWATFEHTANSPNNNFFYIDPSGATKQQVNWDKNDNPIPKKDWLLMNREGTLQASNQMHMLNEDPLHIKAVPNYTISASNTARTHPWGNTANAASAVNNTKIISLNQNIQSMLTNGDPRKNYFLVGATWTKNGVPGTNLQQPEVVGSLTLANSTMETYFQSKNCFECHKVTDPNQTDSIHGLSHIFSTIKPLPIK